jgi:hypothetical protein
MSVKLYFLRCYLGHVKCRGLLLGLFACTAKPEAPPPTRQDAEDPRPKVVVPPPLAPVVCKPLGRPTGELEFVRQRPTDLPIRFDPSGRFAANDMNPDPPPLETRSDEPNCGVWMLDHEVHLGRFGSPRVSGDCVAWPGGGDPCVAWPELVNLDLGPIDAHAAIVADSISPDRARLARARRHTIELLDVESGALLAELSLDEPKPPGTELKHLALAWSNDMPIALIGRATEEDQTAWELRRWAHPSATVEAQLITWENDDEPAEIDEAMVDPLGRWLWVRTFVSDPHGTRWQRRQLPLTAEARQLHTDFRDEGVGDFEDEDHVEAEWLTGTRTARIWPIVVHNEGHEGRGTDELGWASFQLWPRPVRSGPHELASEHEAEEQNLEILGVADEDGVVAWSQCWFDDGLGEVKCDGNRLIPADCEAEGVSDGLDWLLVSCEGSWRLLPLGKTAAARKPVEVVTPDDGPYSAMFGRSGLALLSHRGGVRLLAVDGRERASYPEVTVVLSAKLGPELDLAVGHSPAGLQVFDLATGERLAIITFSNPARGGFSLAFAPDRQRLAVSDGQHIEIHNFTTSKMTRWDAGKVLDLAWRQDGAVLFTGAEWWLPERAWDPATGELAAIQPDPVFLERLDKAELDPSWRWAFEGDDVILRTLDGLALYLEPNDWFVTETGLYDGVGEPEHLFVRVIGDDQPRVFSLASLPEHLHHPNLLEQFVAGVPLPHPRLDLDAILDP